MLPAPVLCAGLGYGGPTLALYVSLGKGNGHVLSEAAINGAFELGMYSQAPKIRAVG